jgi:hypothetical protein
MSNKRTLKMSDIICFLKDGLMQKEKMTEEQAEEFLSNLPTETITKLYSKILEDVYKKRGKEDE